MLRMEKANSLGSPKSYFRVLVDPTELRMIANRMEIEADNALRGQEIEYAFTKSIVLVYEPAAKKDRLEIEQQLTTEVLQ